VGVVFTQPIKTINMKKVQVAILICLNIFTSLCNHRALPLMPNGLVHLPQSPDEGISAPKQKNMQKPPRTRAKGGQVVPVSSPTPMKCHTP